MSSGWDRQNLARLRAILQSLILDEETIRPTDPVRADHLCDAIADTRTLISRLESPFSADAGGRPHAPSGERTQSAHAEQAPSDPPPKWNALANMSVAV